MATPSHAEKAAAAADGRPGATIATSEKKDTKKQRATTDAPHLVSLEFYEQWRLTNAAGRVAAVDSYTGFDPSVPSTVSAWAEVPVPHHGRVRMTWSDGRQVMSDEYRLTTYQVQRPPTVPLGDGRKLHAYETDPAWRKTPAFLSAFTALPEKGRLMVRIDGRDIARVTLRRITAPHDIHASPEGHLYLFVCVKCVAL
jgi:hypothetical protein